MISLDPLDNPTRQAGRTDVMIIPIIRERKLRHLEVTKWFLVQLGSYYTLQLQCVQLRGWGNFVEEGLGEHG